MHLIRDISLQENICSKNSLSEDKKLYVKIHDQGLSLVLVPCHHFATSRPLLFFKHLLELFKTSGFYIIAIIKQPYAVFLGTFDSLMIISRWKCGLLVNIICNVSAPSLSEIRQINLHHRPLLVGQSQGARLAIIAVWSLAKLCFF